MAWHPISHPCGHEHRYQLYGKHKDRDRKAAWLADQACPACRAAEDRARRAAEGPKAHLFFQAAFVSQHAAIVIDIEDGYPIKDALKASGYMLIEMAANACGGSTLLGMLSSSMPPAVWRREWPLSATAFDDAQAEIARLVADGLVRQDNVKLQDRLALNLEAAVHHSTTAAPPKPAAPAKPTYRVEPGKRTITTRPPGYGTI